MENLLYDHAGRPIHRPDLKKDQAAPSVTGVRGYAMLNPSKAMTPYRLAQALRAAAEGDISAQSLLFEDMEEKDAHIFAEVSKRKRAVTGNSWTVLPANDSAQAAKQAEFAMRTLEKLRFEDLLFDMLDAVGKGFSALELTWDISSGQAVPQKAEHKPQAWFQFHSKRYELRLLDGTLDGEELIPFKWIVHEHKAKSGSPYRGALYRVLAWLFLFRNYSLNAWVQFVESFGIPLRLGKYPPGAPEADKDKLLEAAAAIASEAAVVIPEGMDLEIIEQSRRGGANPHRDLLDWSKHAISVAVVGGTLTSGTHDGGAYALGNVHDQVRRDIQKSDTRQAEATLNEQLIRPLVDLNFGPQKAYPRLKIEMPDTEDKKLQAEIIRILAGAGFTKIPVSFIQDKFNIPKPGKDEETLGDLKEGEHTGSPLQQ